MKWKLYKTTYNKLPMYVRLSNPNGEYDNFTHVIKVTIFYVTLDPSGLPDDSQQQKLNELEDSLTLSSSEAMRLVVVITHDGGRDLIYYSANKNNAEEIVQKWKAQYPRENIQVDIEEDNSLKQLKFYEEILEKNA